VSFGSCPVSCLTSSSWCFCVKHGLHAEGTISNSVIDVGEPVTPYGPNLNVVSALDALREGRALTCQTTKKEHILPPPTVVLLDVCANLFSTPQMMTRNFRFLSLRRPPP
jgi:hypothetical protein